MADTSEIRVNTELTPDELHALDLTEELANVLNRVVGWSPSREQDLAELLVKINELGTPCWPKSRLALTRIAFGCWAGRTRPPK